VAALGARDDLERADPFPRFLQRHQPLEARQKVVRRRILVGASSAHAARREGSVSPAPRAPPTSSSCPNITVRGV
jgi:hypothetical protein